MILPCRNEGQGSVSHVEHRRHDGGRLAKLVSDRMLVVAWEGRSCQEDAVAVFTVPPE